MWGSSLVNSGIFSNLLNNSDNGFDNSTSAVISSVTDNTETDGNTTTESVTVPNFSNLSYKEIIKMYNLRVNVEIDSPDFITEINQALEEKAMD